MLIDDQAVDECFLLSQEGCWGCFDDIERLSSDSFAVVIRHCIAIYNALRTHQDTCSFIDGHEISIEPSTAMFLTHNPHKKTPLSIPNELRVLFRQVHFPKPDLALLLKAKCSNLGLKAPTVLAMRLKLVAELTRDLL